MAEKVIIGIPTYAGTPGREQFLRYLSQLSYPNLHILFVTNSGETDAKYLKKFARTLPVTINVTVKQAPKEKEPLDQVVTNRNIIRDFVLDPTFGSEFDWLFFFDHDLVGPVNVIETFLKHKKKLVSGVYLGHTPEKGETVIRPLVYQDVGGEKMRRMNISEVIQPQLMEVAAAGLGCCLIHRSLLDIPFRRINGTEDIPFFHDVKEQKGISLWVDTRAKFAHLKFAPGDSRNKYLNLNNYRPKNKPTAMGYETYL